MHVKQARPLDAPPLLQERQGTRAHSEKQSWRLATTKELIAYTCSYTIGTLVIESAQVESDISVNVYEVKLHKSSLHSPTINA